MLLLDAGVSLSEYRRMHPALADALAERALERRKVEAEAHHADMQLVMDGMGSVVKAIGGVGRAVNALHKMIARRRPIL